MKRFQPKAPPEEDDADGPPPPSTDQTPTKRDQPETPETPPMHSKSRNAEVDFKGQKRSNAPHASVTDPDARLYKTSPGAMLCFMGHTLMENRNGLIVKVGLTHADGRAERKAARDMIHRHSPGSTRQLTLGADKAYDSADVVAGLRQPWFRAETIPRIVSCCPPPPHVAQKARHSAIDGRTTRHPGYAASQKARKTIDLRRENDPPDRFLILLTFGWAKTVGGMAQTVHRGIEKVRARGTMTMAASNLARLPKLLAA